ncbi:glycosyltransferase [Alkalimarinus alittae]|uniref:Glycosyltransferase n=1 Tax=Alkalimarinus alittae TaxID=2961619 RepID=A0ABY6N108_9ALTE|nr:glycosyltransferase [Alkalimarinus alittae]UZE95763.1 glycosyltransferase [Alkalimarinus alittae]
MKVCQFLASGDSGGLAKHLVDLTNGLSEAHEVSVIAPESMKPLLADSINFCAIDFSSGPLKSFFSLFQMYRFLKLTAPDVVCAHGSKAAKKLAFLKPYIQPACIGTLHWIEKKKKYFERLDGVIGVSNAALDGLKLNTQKVIYNGVNISDNIRQESLLAFEGLGIQKNNPTVIAIGRLVKVKGFDVLVNAWQQVNANLLLVGDGPLKQELHDSIVEKGLTHKVFLLGHVDQAHELIRKAELVVISSLHEGFCYVLAEALRYRVPVVSTDVAAANEILPNKLLCPIDDATSLERNLNIQLQRLPELREDLDRIFDWAEVSLSVAHMAEETARFYSFVINEKMNSGRNTKS